MPGSEFLILFGVSFVLPFCQGGITSPPDKTRYTFLPGQTANVTWKFDDAIPNVEFRSWSFTNFDGKVASLGTIYKNINADVKRTLYDVDIVKPATLVLKNVNQSYNGIYSFSLTVPGKAITHSVTVFIARKPMVILNCSSPVTLNETDNFTCLCKGEGGNPPANVTWYKDGVKISDVGTENQTLNLVNVGRENMGTYKCKATSYDHKNYTDNQSINLTVYYKPVSTTIMFSEFPVLINEFLTITCASNGLPKPNFIIFHNDTKVANDMTYYISQVRMTHIGTYKCVASNFLGNDSASNFLHVLVKPSVTLNCSSFINVRRGDDVICQCKCEGGNPPANCAWFKNGTLIGKKGMEMNTLIRSIDIEDGGNYTCVGSSGDRAQDKKSVKVAVYYTTIKFSKNPAIINGSVNMTCSLHGLPASRYVIYHNDSRVASKMTYTISRVNWTHAGTYKCVANNAFKNDSASEFLYVDVRKPTKSSTTIKPSLTTAAAAIPSSSILNGTGNNQGGDDDKDGDSEGLGTGEIVGIAVGVVALLVLVCCLIFYCKYKERDNKSDVNPNDSKVITNHYELEEDQLEGGGNTAKPPDKGEGSQNNAEQKPPGDSLPPVYASVNKDNRQGNTLYASLDSEALKRPSQKKPAENQPKIAPTEYASIDFMKTAKTPNDDSVST